MKRSRFAPRAALFVGLFAASLSWAAIVPRCTQAQVNIERLRVSDPEPGLSGALGTALALKKGNSDFLELDGNAFALYYTEPHSILLSTRGSFGEEDRKRFAASGFGHLRWTVMWWGWAGSELFTQLQYDEFLRLQLRTLVGAGPRFVLAKTEILELDFGTGYMLEYEKLDIPESDPHPRSTLAHRSTSYLSVIVDLKDDLRLAQTVYAQPRFDKPSDIRVLDELELRLALNDTLAMTTSFGFRFDSDPPSEVKKVDVQLKNGIQLQL